MRFERDAIIEGLAALDRKDPQRRLFGSQVHEYRLNPPLRAAVIQAFEKKRLISLPEDYGYFIGAVGNGGAGPYYGLFPFGDHDNGDDSCKWEDGYLIGDLAQPFPHTQDWNLPKSFWAEPEPDGHRSEEEEHLRIEAWYTQLEEQYWNPRIMNGAIPICHLGCALRHWLVVTGPQKGFVWSDDRADYEGIHPLRDSRGEQLTFAEWYLSWLRDPVKAMKRQ